MAALPEAIPPELFGVPGSDMEFSVSLEALERFKVLIAGLDGRPTLGTDLRARIVNC